MSNRVLNGHVSITDAKGRFKTLEPGTPWTAELGKRITNPSAWTDVTIPDEHVAAEPAEEPAGESDEAAGEVFAGESEESPAVPDRYKGLKKPELQAALEERGLDSTGKVAELVQRLVEDDAATQ